MGVQSCPQSAFSEGIRSVPAAVDSTDWILPMCFVSFCLLTNEMSWNVTSGKTNPKNA